MYLERTLTKVINQVSRQFPALLVTGPRQVGKTTCLRHAADESRTYVTLDDPQARLLAQEDPKLFLQRFRAPVLIDEIQYAPELLPLIKMAIDTHQRQGDYWLTGSQQFHLMQNVSESLAGRIAILQLLGFSRCELDRQAHQTEPFSCSRVVDNNAPSPNLMDIYQRIWTGSFPAIAIDPQLDHTLFYSSYLQTYLQRDVKALANIGDEMAFIRFIRAAAARTGQLLNLSNMAADADIAPNTAKSWLSILRASGLIYLLEPYHTNLSKRLIKSPKLYFLDTGLAAYLTEWSSCQTLEAGAMSGAIFETWVISEIIKTYWHCGKSGPLYYYRDKDQKEIDLLIVRDGTITPIEIKKTTMPTKSDTRHFSVLKNLKTPIGPGAVLCLTESAIPITDTIHALPVTCL